MTYTVPEQFQCEPSIIRCIWRRKAFAAVRAHRVCQRISVYTNAQITMHICAHGLYILLLLDSLENTFQPRCCVYIRRHHSQSFHVKNMCTVGNAVLSTGTVGFRRSTMSTFERMPPRFKLPTATHCHRIHLVA